MQQDGIVVVGGAHEELDGVALAGLSGGVEVLLLLDVGADGGAHALVVEGGVVADGVGVHQQAVVGDNRDAGGLGLGLHPRLALALLGLQGLKLPVDALVVFQGGPRPFPEAHPVPVQPA